MFCFYCFQRNLKGFVLSDISRSIFIFLAEITLGVEANDYLPILVTSSVLVIFCDVLANL